MVGRFTHGRYPRCGGRLGCLEERGEGWVARPFCDVGEVEDGGGGGVLLNLMSPAITTLWDR